MKLIDYAHKYHKLWSVRFSILAAAFGAMELVLPMWKDVVSPGTFAAMSTVSAVLAAVSRVIKQEALEKDNTP